MAEEKGEGAEEEMGDYCPWPQVWSNWGPDGEHWLLHLQCTVYKEETFRKKNKTNAVLKKSVTN